MEISLNNRPCIKSWLHQGVIIQEAYVTSVIGLMLGHWFYERGDEVVCQAPELGVILVTFVIHDWDAIGQVDTCETDGTVVH